MLYLSEGGRDAVLNNKDITAFTESVLKKLGRKNKVLILPPDATRCHSRAGIITDAAFTYFRESVADIMPAIGTHKPMSAAELKQMFPGTPTELFRIHNWRGDLKTIGSVPADFINKTFETEAEGPMPVQLNRLVADGGHDLILSAGQVVPHEIAGMANHSKNILIGTGGPEVINRSHYLGAVYNMERILGRTDTPVRRLLNYMAENFLKDLPVVYILTVAGTDSTGSTVVRGMFAGDDEECFRRAAALSREVNVTLLDKRLKRVVAYLPKEEYGSTWIGNKAIYRSRTAIADGGELTIIAEGIKQFGEDEKIDALIRKYGYHGTPATMKAVSENEDLRSGLSAAAHLIHGSSEGRFKITYATSKLTREEIESAGYSWCDPAAALKRFRPEQNSPGLNIDSDGNEFFLIRNAALGLWSADALD